MHRYRFALTGLAVASIGIVACVVGLANQAQTKTDLANCSSLPQSKIGSERSLSSIVRSGLLLTVRLKADGEKNYSPPGGHIKGGETPQIALARELEEEIGIKADPATFKLYKTYCQSLTDGIQRTYYYTVPSWTGTIQPATTADSIKWVDYSYAAKKRSDSELSQLLLYLHNDKLIN